MVITGTSLGMSAYQKQRVSDLLRELTPTQAQTCIHPPDNLSYLQI